MSDMQPDEIEGVVEEASGEDSVARAEAALRRANEAVTEALAREDGDVPCEFVCGRAGTGKSYWAKQQIAQDPTWGKLAATTGIAAVNLDAITINSVLKFFDTASLQESYLQGNLTRIIHDLALQYRRLVIDEVSMMDARQLDYIYRATAEANGYKDIKEPLGLTLVGDFAQLPPVKAIWAFRAQCWGEFASHVRRLTHVWRQDQLEFLDALDAARRGQGEKAASILQSVGIEWHSSLDTTFDGTTIIPKNDAVDRYNGIALDRLSGSAQYVSSRRWGKLRSEWKNIPERLSLKLGAYVMILSNDPEWTFVNGDCGHLESLNTMAYVRLVRNDQVVAVPRIVRSVSSKDKPTQLGHGCPVPRGVEGYYTGMHQDIKRKYVEGQVEYFPLRLAYASTVHKSQGLSLDRLQMDFRQSFFGSPAMLYVALSRCRTLQGLRLVGDKERFIQRCKCDPAVGEWL